MINTLFIAGPTASGKSEYAVELSKRLNGEIISCDSIQIYKGMDIGTAKIQKEDQDGIPHHLIDIVNPDENYNISHYGKDARNKIIEISGRKKLPVVVGGTGLYMDAVLYDLSLGESPPNRKVRKKLEKKAQDGTDLYKKLMSVDPATAVKTEPENTKRIIRALEVYLTTGEPLSKRNKKTPNSNIHPCIIGLNCDRKLLHKKIEKRVHHMIDQGLIEEVSRLLKIYPRDLTAFEAIGYKEVISYFKGLCTKEEMIRRIIINTRQLAKRQISWFKRYPEIHWFYTDEEDPKDLIRKGEELAKKEFGI